MLYNTSRKQIPQGYKIFLSPEALSDLEGVLMAHSKRDYAGAGARSANQLLDEALSLSRAPERAQIVPELGRPDLREIRHRHQRIVYRLHAARQSVEIVRVLLDTDFLRVPDPPSMSGNRLSMTHGEDNEAQAWQRLEQLPTPLSFKTPKEIILEV